MTLPKCRICGVTNVTTFLDLDFAPPSNAYLTHDQLCCSESHFPLVTYSCSGCSYVFTEDYQDSKALFTPDYAYFSSSTSSWLSHTAAFCDGIVEELALTSASFVVEVGCNDGYLLKNFIKKGIPSLGIEPTTSTANAARLLGVEIVEDFFSAALALKIRNAKRKADLIIANNVLAHVPQLNDFTAGLRSLIADNGIVSVEVPHLLRLVENNAFDTIYHEHFSYFSLGSLIKLFGLNGLRVISAKELTTHGGSLRIYATPVSSKRLEDATIAKILDNEKAANVLADAKVESFSSRVRLTKLELLDFLVQSSRQKVKVVGYGAAAKANTLLNFFGIRRDLIAYIADAAPSKQGLYMPGSHIPIVAPEVLYQDIDHLHVIIFTWNINDEIYNQLVSHRGPKTSYYRVIPRFSKIAPTDIER